MASVTPESAGARIEREVSSWPGVTAAPHRFAGREYLLGTSRERSGREVGHVHGDRQADLPLAKPLRDALVAGDYTSKHHLFPDSGWVTFYLDRDGPVEDAIDVFRAAYLWQVPGLQKRGYEPVAEVDVLRELATLGFGPDVEAAFDRLLAR